MIIYLNTERELPGQLSDDEMTEFCKYVKKNLTFLENNRIFAETSDFIERWFNLWPRGVKTGGLYVKTDKSGCKKKMNKFRRQHPNYTDDIILQATETYINSTNGSGFMKLAPYFIEKNGVSVLEGCCEEILQGTNNKFIREI